MTKKPTLTPALSRARERGKKPRSTTVSIHTSPETSPTGRGRREAPGEGRRFDAHCSKALTLVRLP